jgi:hypothetical protein
VFIKTALREICAGLGNSYITFSGDLEGTSYSSGRIGSLDVRELWMLTQRFDIDTAEIPIFAAWLEMALAYKVIPLPLTKLEKFNQPNFQGRRWPWVDPMKDAKADELAINTLLTSRSRICNENGADFEEIIEEQAMERILIEEAGLLVSNAAQPDEAATNADSSPALSKIEELKAKMDAYGVGVRAGSLTPQEADEESFRAAVELPPLSDAARSAWEEDKGFRHPITLLHEGQQPAPRPGDDPNEEDNKPPKKSRKPAAMRK